MRAFTRASTSLGFSPLRITMMPSTTSSSSSRPTWPTRGRSPSRTVATFFTRMGTPSTAVMMMFSMSATLLSRPMPRTTKAWPFFSITSPPTLMLLRVTASYTSRGVRSYWIMRPGSASIS